MLHTINAGTMAVVLDETRTKILLHLRRDHQKWGLPGGSVDFGETFEQAVIREVEEETGYTIKVNRVFGAFSNPEHFVFSYPDGNKVQGFMLGFECSVIGGEAITSNSESLDVQWFPLDDMPENLFENHKTVIDGYLTADTFILD
ncbi:MAG: NUDIX domain-containing protein [Alphaproteobacteria bacterium]|nr:NUDIX domain-containing protein [Alphaproteobacteria bacterium]MDD9919610.1 NUDIX domain-containing protein [Alphaproteobacteria bacterium]